MILSPQQERAIARVKAWLLTPAETRAPYFFLAGFAGTGKTTIARLIAELKPHVRYAGPTGKSAAVMRSMGCVGAQTAHSLIYQPADKSKKHYRELELHLGKLLKTSPRDEAEIEKTRANLRDEEKNLARPMFSLNLESELRGADLLILDEGSMFDQQFGADLVSFEVPILVLGDPAQLPPVFGRGYFTAREPDVMLTEIHRQALDNPIIAMATTVREGGYLKLGNYGDSAVVRKVEPEQVLAADQVLVGRNATRRASNRRVRELKGLTSSPFPLLGERLVCLRNNNDLGILNGGVYNPVEDAVDSGGFINMRVRPSEGGALTYLSAHREHFLGRGEEISTWDRRDAEEFDYGYAMTVHKFQGSQDRNIILFDEWFRDHRKAWLYTGLTRAMDTVRVVQKGE